MTVLLLARHGETDWNREKRWQGHADLPLSGHGRKQALDLAERLASCPLAAVYSSDLRRASETASVIAEARGLSVTTMRALREVDVGSWTGLSRSEVKERFPEAYASWRRDAPHPWEGGESYAEMGARVIETLRAIARAHAEDRVLIVAHSGAIRTALARAVGVDYASDREAVPKVSKGSLSAVVVDDDGSFRPLDADLDEHLRSAAATVS